jgi:hypothetical protein
VTQAAKEMPVAEKPAAEAPKKEKKKEEPKPKKEAAPKPAADEEEEAKPAPKPKNPLDLLPPSSMIMDDWKRLYSNTKAKDFREVAIKGGQSVGVIVENFTVARCVKPGIGCFSKPISTYTNYFTVQPSDLPNGQFR